MRGARWRRNPGASDLAKPAVPEEAKCWELVAEHGDVEQALAIARTRYGVELWERELELRYSRPGWEVRVSGSRRPASEKGYGGT